MRTKPAAALINTRPSLPPPVTANKVICCVVDNDASSVGLAVGLAVGFVVLIIIVVVVVVVVLRRRRSRSPRFHTSLLALIIKWNLST